MSYDVFSSWQFPHFYGLAEARNAEYAYAGYRMLGSTSPKSAMVWSAANIGALVLIMLWAHFMYTRADQDSVVNPQAGPALKKIRPERPGLRIFQTKTAQSSPTRKNFRPKRPGPV